MKKIRKKRLAVLTGGGDCPGLNAAIRSVTRTGINAGFEVYGVEHGFLGFDRDDIRQIDLKEVSGILPRGGTLLKSSRFNPFRSDVTFKRFNKRFESYGFDALVIIGGDGSLGIALDLWKKHKFPVIGIPKTIDNDVYGTDHTIGFHTAVQTAVDAIDKVHTTAESHDFVMVVEVMGRHCGYLAAYAGLAGGADYILVPERPTPLSEVVKVIRDRQARGKNFSIVVAAEDAKILDHEGKIMVATPTLYDDYGKIKLGGVGFEIRDALEDALGIETRCTVLGHVQRGGSPVAFDRILATAMGYEAVRLVEQKKFGQLVVWEKGKVGVKDLAVVRKGDKRLSESGILAIGKEFFG